MRNHQSGLHKEVSAIFEGVWNPETDNIQPVIVAPAASSAAYIFPGAQGAGDFGRESRFASIVKGIASAPGLIFRSRARREKKRLGSISKHLMINMPS
ncbi:MAG: hypothetical protein CEE38_04610 [Planctomycetes bacterium B3_Pla]|nr:MAG: hypothetical protein CEE38_04610 [Planctomycetes bacterium B3_Pla]